MKNIIISALSLFTSKLNWKARFRNKTWMIAFIAFLLEILDFVLQKYGINIGMNEVIKSEIIDVVLYILIGIGLIQDPTTAGICDTKLAMSYDEPRCDDDCDCIDKVG